MQGRSPCTQKSCGASPSVAHTERNNNSKPSNHKWIAFCISPQTKNLHAFLLETVQVGEHFLHLLSPHFLHLLSPIAISYISHGIRLIRHITSSILVKLGKLVPFLAEVTAKASNPEDAGPTTAPSGRKAAFQDLFLQRTTAVDNALAFQVHQTSKFQ